MLNICLFSDVCFVFSAFQERKKRFCGKFSSSVISRSYFIILLIVLFYIM
nr:MAG TPA: hypothetical protein [Caudoviricetes sp.]